MMTVPFMDPATNGDNAIRISTETISVREGQRDHPPAPSPIIVHVALELATSLDVPHHRHKFRSTTMMCRAAQLHLPLPTSPVGTVSIKNMIIMPGPSPLGKTITPEEIPIHLIGNITLMRVTTLENHTREQWTSYLRGTFLFVR